MWQIETQTRRVITDGLEVASREPQVKQMNTPHLQTVLPPRDRLVIWSCLGAITLLAWTYLVRLSTMSSGTMSGMDMAMPMSHRWTPGDMGLMFVMWAVMMVAMMLPGTSPMLMMYARVARGRGLVGGPRLWLFAGGYIIVWTMFSACATIIQTALQNTSVVSDQLRVAPFVGGLILIFAGLYQFTPLKSACLTHCRSPMGFFMTEWREGKAGALIMGIRHGSYCVGCCWPLMLLLFVAGVMNLLWVAVIIALVMVEKLSPYQIANATGTALVGLGLLLAAFG
jgi:predicted metal-binding membrane protein